MEIPADSGSNPDDPISPLRGLLSAVFSLLREEAEMAPMLEVLASGGGRKTGTGTSMIPGRPF